jgi:glyoxylase-like metal-dependent hydrolase (beta-lactamase superfamily II)
VSTETPASSHAYAAVIAQNPSGACGLKKANNIMDLSRELRPENGTKIGSWHPHHHDVREQEIDIYRLETEDEDASMKSPGEWIESWRNLECNMSPLAQKVLEYLQSPEPPVSNRWSEISNEVVSGIRQVPLTSPTLPPAEHTNAYLIGDDELILVDPATYELSERNKLEKILRGLLAQGMKLKAIVLTHHHFDHFGAAEWASKTFEAPIWAHEITQELLADKLSFTRKLQENDQINLGNDRSGRPFSLEVRFTPGHAPGHIVLCDTRPGSGAMIVGDMVAAVGTIIIDPEEGDMHRYIEELRRLRTLQPGCVFPAHGPPIGNGDAKFEQYIKHRLTREKMVLGALMDHGPALASELLDQAYADTPRHLYPLAERACLAHLIKLAADGKICLEDGRYRAT